MTPATHTKIEALSRQIEQLRRAGRYPAAIPLATEVSQLLQQSKGQKDARFIAATVTLANLYRMVEDYDRARRLYRWALQLKRQEAAPNQADIAALLNSLGDLFRAMGQFTLAEQHLTEALTIRQHLYPGDQPDLARTLHSLGRLHLSRGNYAEAEAKFNRAHQMRQATLPDDDPALAHSLHDLARLHHAWGKYDQARTRYRDAFRRRLAVWGKTHPEVGQSLRDQARLFHDLGQYEEAERLYTQAVAISRELFGAEHPLYATDLEGLARLYHAWGRYEEAETRYQAARHIRETKLGRESLPFAHSVENLARLRYTLGDYTEARRLQQWAWQIKRQGVGETHPDIAPTLDDLARSWQALGDYERAVSLFKESLALRRESVSATHPDLAATLDDLAVLYQTMGDYRRAEQHYLDALEIRQQTLSATHPDLADSLHNLATLYAAIADYDQAAPLFEQALDIRRQALGAQHPAYAESLFEIGRLALATDAQQQAISRLAEARAIQQNSLGATHPAVARTLAYLADARCAGGDYAAAEPLYIRAKEIWQAGGGETHPDFGRGLHHLAALYRAQGRYDAAKSIYHWALQIRRAALGDSHPDVAATLTDLAATYTALGRLDLAQQTMAEAAAIHDRMIGAVFAIGSERQRLGYLRTFSHHLDTLLSLITGHLADSVEARQTAYGTLLRRKALGAEVSLAQREALLSRRYPDLAEKFRALQTLRQQIGQKMLAGPGPEPAAVHQQTLADWTGQREKLEVELARQVEEMDLSRQLAASGWQHIRAALPEGAAVVEWVRFTPFDFKARPAHGEQPGQAARYVAFVLTKTGPLQMFDLGEADPLDRMIEDFRFTITGDPAERAQRGLFYGEDDESDTRPDVAIGQPLRAALFDPLSPAIGSHRRLFLAPAGDLNRLPFEILPLADGGRLIDDYRLSYLTVGRDVLRFGTRAGGQATQPVVIADPDFDLEATTPVIERRQASGRQQSKDLRGAGVHFGRLPGTQTEGRQIAEMLEVTPWMAEVALEATLKAASSPRLLHIATHGFFLPDQERDDSDTGGGGKWGRLSHGLESPLLRSGLALAGANTWLDHGELPPEAEDGILTAEDVAGLDLRATELVVLSACETGLGVVQIGEGVFGLRRAFVLAGAKTLVMSLWKVPDRQTQMLMVDFYRRLLAGEPRAEALRQAQLTLQAKYPDPLYWGAFICQGEPERMTPLV